MGIESNVRQREEAEALYDMACSAALAFEDNEHFWRCLNNLVAPELPPPEVAAKDRPMTADEAAKFGRSPMPFGEFKGEPVGDVPLERLAWYVDEGREFSRKVDRYMKSPRVRNEIAGE